MISTAVQSQPDHARRIEELGRIIMAYSEVTERLQQSHEQLNETVRALRTELGEKNRLLERKNRLAALGEMAAGMAHEIRNPLGGIQLYASMLAQDVADRPDSLQTVRKISGGVRRLEALVGQVLQFSREIAAHPEPADLAEIVDGAVEIAAAKFDELGVRCVVEGPRPLAATVDPLLLGQALLNLLLNAAEAVDSAAGRRARTARRGPAVPGRPARSIVRGPPAGPSARRSPSSRARTAGPDRPAPRGASPRRRSCGRR